MSKKNLVYFTVGGNSSYANLTKLCIESLRQTNDLQNTDILIMCDEEYKQNIVDLHTDIMITKKNNNGIEASMKKVEIFNYEKIWMYDKVLYLDSDIIVYGNINILFDRVNELDKLYVFRDQTIVKGMDHKYWWTGTLTEEDILFFNTNNKGFFNCGQFLFKVSKEMEGHFNQVLTNIKENTKEYFYEQTFMNEYFLKNLLTIEDEVIKKYVHLCISRDDFDLVLFHFCGNDTINDKLNKMRNKYNQYLHFISNKK